MKRLKSGFSLAELLIAMGIVSVVAVMAVSISKNGIDSAYNIYYYTGYQGLHDALTEAFDEEEKKLSGDVSTSDSQKVLKYIAEDVFEGSCKSDSDNSSSACTVLTNPTRIEIKPENGKIIYSFRYLGKINNIGGTTTSSDAYEINMTVPTTRRKSGANAIVGNTVRFIYLPDFENGMIVPVG